MPDTYIIDGYNLIHALGMIRKDAGPGGLQASRTQLLRFLAQSFGERSSAVTVIFDARQAPPKLPREQQHHGIAIRFAAKGQTADDLIEALISADAAPKSLIVVSNDARLQHAAQRRQAQAWTHEMLLDFFDKRSDASSKPRLPAAEKSESLSPEEARDWQNEFADVENDPDLKEFFDHDKYD